MFFEVSSFETERDGLVIRGLRFEPAGRGRREREQDPFRKDEADQRRRPVYPFPVILSHGFMNNGNGMRRYAEFLSYAGCVCYTFDFCGGCVKGSSDGDSRRMSVLTEVRDLEAVMDFVLADTGAERTVLLGASQGGFVSALAAAGRPDLVEKLVLLYPAFCIPDDARRGKMMFARFDPRQIPEEIQCGPMALGKMYAKDVIRMDPFREIRSYPGAVLILHGTRDRLVKPVYARRAYDAYISERKKQSGGESPDKNGLELIMLRGADHGFRGRLDEMAQTLISEFVFRTAAVTGRREVFLGEMKDTLKLQKFLDGIRKKNGYELVDRYVIRDGKTHPFALVIPGGGYYCVCSFIEGVPFAKALNQLGISVFILYYSVKEKARIPAPMDDAARAVREILDRADSYRVKREGYSVWGSSAGGHLAAAFGTESMGWRRYGLPKPGSVVLAYPVISMDRAVTHRGTHDNLLGEDPGYEEERAASVENCVTPEFPPTFVWCGDVDATVPAENTRRMAAALEEAGVPHQCEVIPGVDHGVGPGTGTAAEGWIRRAAEFCLKY